MGNIIQMGAAVDISALKSGMGEFEQVVSSTMKDATDQLKQMSEDGARAITQVSDAALQGARAQRELARAKRDYAIAARTAMRASDDDVTSLARQVIAKDKLTEAELEYARVTTLSTAGIKQFETASLEAGQAATFSAHEAKAEMALLGEEIGVKIPRHLRGFVAEIPGVGMAFQALFAPTAVLMLIGIISEIPAKIREVSSAMAGWDEAAKKTYEWMTKSNEELAKSNRALEEERVKLNELGLTGSALARQQLANAETNIKSKERERDAQNRTYLEAKKVLDGTHEETVKDKEGGEIVHRVSNQSGKSKEELDAIKASAQKAGDEAQKLNAEIEKLKQVEIPKLKFGLKDAGAAEAKAALEEKANAARKAEEEARKEIQDRHQASEAIVKTAETSLTRLKEVHSMSAAEEAAYWQRLSNAAKVGSYEQREEARKASKARAESEKENEKDLEEMTKVFNKAMEEQAKGQQKYQDAVAEGTAIHAKANDEMALFIIQTQVETGALTPLGAAQKEAAIHADEHRAALAKLRAEMKALNNNHYIKPDERKAEEQKINNKISQEEGAGALTKAKDQDAIAKQIAAPYQRASQLITHSFTTGINSWIDGTKKFGAAMQSAWKSFAMGAIQNIEQVGEKWLQHEILKVAQHSTATAATVAVDAAGTASSAAIEDAANAKSGLKAAKKAFKNTYATVSDWPVVGPTLAPILASAAFMAVAAFDNGGIVPRTGLSLVHQSEGVLTAPTTAMLQKVNAMVNGGAGAGGGGVHYHDHSSYSAMDGAGVGKVLRRNRGKVFKEVARAARLQNLGSL